MVTFTSFVPHRSDRNASSLGGTNLFHPKQQQILQLFFFSARHTQLLASKCCQYLFQYGSKHFPSVDKYEYTSRHVIQVTNEFSALNTAVILWWERQVRSQSTSHETTKC